MVHRHPPRLDLRGAGAKAGESLHPLPLPCFVAGPAIVSDTRSRSEEPERYRPIRDHPRVRRPATGRNIFRLASRLLWPPPARVTLTRSRRRPVDVTTELILLPAQARPRLLVPVERRAAAAAVRRYGEPQSPFNALAPRRSGWRWQAASAGLFRQRLRIAVPAGSVTIESYLREALGRDVRVSMHLGAARPTANPSCSC